MDPLLTKDGEPYGPIRYKELVQECYYISKGANIPYSDALNMTPTERGYILSFLIDEAKKIEKQREEIKKKAQNKNQ